MDHIAPDQEDDNHFFHVLTQGQDSDSSQEDIHSSQGVLQQAQHSPSGPTPPVTQAESTQVSAIDQGCSFWTESAPIWSGEDSSPPPPSRPQRIAGLPQGGAFWTTFLMH